MLVWIYNYNKLNKKISELEKKEILYIDNHLTLLKDYEKFLMDLLQERKKWKLLLNRAKIAAIREKGYQLVLPPRGQDIPRR